MHKSDSIFLFIVLGFFSFFNSFTFHDIMFLEGCTFFIISIFSAGIICFYPTNVATLLKVYFVFTYIFFGIVPVLELDESKVYWGGRYFNDTAYLQGGIYVFIFSALVFVSYIISCNKTLYISHIDLSGERFYISGLQKSLLLLLSFTCLIVIAWYNSYNVYSLLFRGGDLVERESFGSGPIDLIYSSSIKYIPLTTAILVLYKLKKSYLIKTVLLVIGLICAFPTSMARLAVPTFYFPLLFAFLPSLLAYNRLVVVLFFGILAVFPFLNNFRNYSATNELTFSVDYGFLLEGHFDAFQNFVRIMDLNIITYGNQFLGAMLFFVPRSIWPDKPIGTGHYLASQASYSFDNISATWYAEGWANFGFLGAASFSVFIGYLMGYLDKKFWNNQLAGIGKVIYLFLLGYLFFLLRGDLLSSLAYLIGTIVAIYLPYLIITKKVYL